MASSTIKAQGSVIDGTALATTVPNATKTNTSSVALSAGVWLVIFNAALNVATGKQFQASIVASNVDRAAEQNFSGGLVRYSLSVVLTLTSSATIYGTMYHNSGSSVSINTNDMRAVRIA